MKKNELMVGDWALFHTGCAKVTGITDTGIHFVDRFGEGIASGADPIPLTPEILKKNGFFPDEFSPFYLPIDDGSIRLSGHQYGLYCNILRPYQRYDGVCNYLYQLQHALRQCGIEIELKP